MKRFACLAIPFALAACGDNTNSDTIDAATDVDSAVVIDAAVDAPDIDAPPAHTFSGTISVVEARLRNMGGAGVDGHGIQIGVSFADNLLAVPPTDMTPGATTTSGCFVWKYAVADLPGLLGSDQGPVQVTIADADPAFPPCIYAGPAAGYICPDTASSGTGGVLAAGTNPGTSTFTITTSTFGPEDAGRYVRLSGTGVAALDTAFPIIAIVSANTALLATGMGVNLTLPGAATFTTLAGIGPVPDLAAGVPRNFMADTDVATVSKAGTGMPEVDNFTDKGLTLGGPDVGDDFTLGTGPSAAAPVVNKVLPTAIPTDGSEFVIGCDNDAACGGSIGSLISISTTDASVAGLSPFSFPTPVATRTSIRCVSLSSREVRVPAAISAYLMPSQSSATRIQTTFIRGNFGPIVDTVNPTAVTNFLAGHGEVGFTTLN